jgi:RNA recognition motif-containing protein
MSDHYGGRPRSDSSEIAYRKIFIGGLSYSTDEETLKRYFRPYGNVQDAVVMKDPGSRRSRGFGFITFYDAASVDIVFNNEPHIIDGRKVEAKRAVPRSEMNVSPALKGQAPPNNNAAYASIKAAGPSASPSLTGMSKYSTSPGNSTDGRDLRSVSDEYAYNKVFVGGLHYDTRDQEFRNYFSRYGRVVHAEVMFNRETHKSRGFGFIIFEVEESAIRVCEVAEHVIDGKVVEVKRAIPRSKINSVSTPGSQQGSSLLSSPATNTMNSFANIRAEVRRTASFGNSSGLPSSSPMTLSGNSSTLRAKLPGNGNAPNPLMPNRAVSSTSYAAALKLGGVPEDQKMDVSGHDSALMSSFLFSGSGSNSHQHGDIGMVRASRALSEPLVKYEGSGLLGGDAVDFSQFMQAQTSSQNVSRSSSVVLPSGSSGGNLLNNTNLASMTFSPEGSVLSRVGSHATLDKRYSESLFPGDASTVSNMFFSSPLSAQFDGMDLNGSLPGALNLPPPIQQQVHFDGSMHSDYGRSSRGSLMAKSPGTYPLTGYVSFASMAPLAPATNSQDKLFSTPSRDIFDVPHQTSNGSLKSNSNQPTPQHAIPSPQSWSNMVMNDQASHTNGLWQHSQQPVAQLPRSYSIDQPAVPMPSLSFDGGALFPGEDRGPALFSSSFSRTPSRDDGPSRSAQLGIAPQQHSSSSWLAGGDFASFVSSSQQQQEQQQQYDWTGSFGNTAGQQQQQLRR